jgi:DNA repair protein RadC
MGAGAALAAGLAPVQERDALDGASSARLAIGAWPAGERPRERLLARGAGALSDAELIALFLRVGVAGKSAVDLARALIARFGSLRALLDAPAAQLCTVRGVGTAKATQLQAIAELSRRALIEQSRAATMLESPGVVRDYLKLMIGTRSYEVFACLYLDARNRLLHGEEIARGTLTQATVYPREIVRQALALNAAALIVAHNHPSGSAMPSTADRQLTLNLQAALGLVDVRLLDHFVVATNEICSFAEHGWL